MSTGFSYYKWRNAVQMKKIVAALMVAALAVFVAACGGSDDSSSSESASTGSTEASTGKVGTAPNGFELSSEIEDRVAGGEPHIVVSYGYPSIPFAVPLKKGALSAGEKLGADVEFTGPASGKPEEQVSELQTLITQGNVDALAVAPLSAETLNPVIAQAIDAGIPVINFNIESPGSKSLAYIGATIEEGGEIAGEELAKLTAGEKGKSVVFTLDASSAVLGERFAGIEKGAEGSGIEFVGPIEGGTDPAEEFSAVQNGMTANGDAIAITSVDCCTATAAAKWAQQEGEEIPVSGFDASEEILDFIRSGAMAFSVGQNPRDQAEAAVTMLYDYLKNGGSIENQAIPNTLITKANVDEVESEG